VTSPTVPIFVNGSRVTATPGSPLGQVLGRSHPDLFALLMDGSGQVTDARGLPVDPDAPVYSGAIYRIFRSARPDEATNA
jgi:hypothetical protein